MITASEALKLVNKSDANVDMYIKLIEPHIKKIAEEGKRSYDCYVDGLWSSVETNKVAYTTLTDIQKLVSDKLKIFGYRVSLGRSGDTYVPPGLTDNYGEGPKHVNICLIISW